MADDWDSTLKEELGVKVLPSEKFAPRKRQTRGDVEKRERRQKARRWTAYAGLDALQRKVEARLERLECTNFGDALLEGDKGEADDGNDSEEFQANEEDEDDSMSDSEDDHDDDDGDDGDDGAYNIKSGSKKAKKGKAKSKAKPKAKAKKKVKAVVAATEVDIAQAGDVEGKPIPPPKASSRERKKARATNKRQRPAGAKARRVRSFGEVLLDDNARKLSAAKTFEDLEEPDYLSATAPPSRYPARRLCVVSGVPARYKDPDSGLPFINSSAFEQLKEQPPPWVRASASAPFHESLRIIAEERAASRARLVASEADRRDEMLRNHEEPAEPVREQEVAQPQDS